MMPPAKDPLTVLVISGATGFTASQVVNAALAQFDEPHVAIIKKTNVRSRATIRQILDQYANNRLVVCHTLVTSGLQEELRDQAQRRMIPILDVLGGLVAVFADQLGVEPRRKAGRSYRLHKEYFDRMDAVSFTLEHDDGAGMADLHKADVVLVGVSRVSKSVTCFYLGYHGIRAANVPLVIDCEMPEILRQLPKEKVIGLMINANRLQKMRAARQKNMGAEGLEYYVDPDAIVRELRYANDLISRFGWRRIDVSYMAVEETARKIIEMIRK